MATQPLYSGGGEEWMSVFGRNVRDASDAEKVQLIRAIQELTVQSSRAQSAAEKLLVEQEANRYDAAAKAAETLASLKKARAEGDWHTFSIASENMRKILDIQADTIYKVAASEYAPFILKADKAKSAAKENPNTAYWNAFISGLLETGKSPLGQDYVAELYTKATTGRNWRDELASEGHGEGSYEYAEMLKFESEAKAIRESQESLKGFVDRFTEFSKTGDSEGAKAEFDRMAGTPAGAYLNTLGMGMDVDTLKAKAADLRSNKNTERLDQQIDFLNGLLKQSYGQGEDSPNYVNALKNEQYQAWAADRGLTIGKVTLDDAGNVVSVVKGKDDLRAARMYTNQMQRDPLATQRRYRATKDVVRAEWTQGDQADEPQRDQTDTLTKSFITYEDREGSIHSVHQFSSGDGKTVRYWEPGANKEIKVGDITAVMKPGTTVSPPKEVKVLVDGGKLMSASALSGELDKLKTAQGVPLDVATALFEKENNEKKAGKAGSPQFVDGIDLGIHARNGERVLLTAEGKRITVPKNAKVTKLDSLSPESAHTFDKLRAGRVNRGIANTDALSTQQKDDALGGLDEMSLAEKRAEAQRIRAEQEKAQAEGAADERMGELAGVKHNYTDSEKERLAAGAVFPEVSAKEARDYDATMDKNGVSRLREAEKTMDAARTAGAIEENKHTSGGMPVDRSESIPTMTPVVQDAHSEKGGIEAADRTISGASVPVVGRPLYQSSLKKYMKRSLAPGEGDTERATRLSMLLGKRSEINAKTKEDLRKKKELIEAMREQQRANKVAMMGQDTPPLPSPQ